MFNRFRSWGDIGLAFLSTASTVGVVLFAYLGTFSRYGADDYCFSRRLFGYDNILQATLDWYLNTSNRYTTMLLIGISEWFGRSAISYLPALAIGLWLAGLTWLLTLAARKLKLHSPWLAGFALASSIVFFSILQAPNRYQSVFWRSGMVTYFLPLVFLSFLVGLIFSETWRETPLSSTRWRCLLVWLWIGFFFAGGLSETTLAMQGGVFGIAILAVWFVYHGMARPKLLSMLFSGLTASIAALIVIFLAPANALRVEAFGPPPPLTEVFSYSFIFAWDFIRETFRSMPTPSLVSLMTAVFLGMILFTESKLLAFRWFGVFFICVAVMTYLLVFFSMLPSMYGQHSYPGARSLMATRAVMVFGIFGMGLLAGWYLRSITLNIMPSLLPFFVLAVFSIYPLYSVRQAIITQLPRYRTYAEQWDLRDGQIRDAVARGETDLVVIQIDDMDGVLEYKVDTWVNRCAAEFYGLRTLTAP